MVSGHGKIKDRAHGHGYIIRHVPASGSLHAIMVYRAIRGWPHLRRFWNRRNTPLTPGSPVPRSYWAPDNLGRSKV